MADPASTIEPPPAALVNLIAGTPQPRLPAANINLPNPAASLAFAPAVPSPIGVVSAAVPQAVTDILGQRDPGFDAFWARMVPGESGGKDVPNFRYDPTHTASGVPQITDTNWKALAPRLGIDTSKYPTTMSAPPDYQKAVAKLMHRMYGDTPWDAAHGGLLPTGGTANADPIIAAARARSASDDEVYARGQQMLQTAIAKIGAEGQRYPEVQKQLAEARAKADAATDRALKLTENPPQMQDRGIIERMGGLATVVGILGGLVTRQPFMGSMNAAASAVEAYNQGDMRNYNIQRDNWKSQTDLLFKIAEINNQRASDILRDQQMSDNEKTAQLTALFSAMGADRQLQELRDKGLGGVEDALITQFNAQQAWDRTAKQEQIAHDNRVLENDLTHPENQIYRDWETQFSRPAAQGGAGRPPTVDERMKKLNEIKAGTAQGGYEASKEINIVDKDGKTIERLAARERRNGLGWVRSDNGQPIEVPEGGRVELSSPGAGRQQAAQVTSLRGAGNEAAASLGNLVDLPKDSSLGMLMGVQYAHPESQIAALQRLLGRELTSEETDALFVTFSGLGRSLATIEAQGRAQGLVGLASQMDKLIPQSGTTVAGTLRRLAEIRQIIDRGMENASVTPGLSQQERALFDKIKREVSTAVPWSVRDVNDLEFGKDNPNSIKSFVQKINLARSNIPPSAAVDALTANPTLRDQFDQKYGAGSAAKVLGEQQ